MSTRHVVTLTFSALLGAFGISGCGDNEGISTDFKKPASERTDIDLKSGSNKPLQIPGEEAFNFNSLRSGQTGSGQGSAAPQGKNGVLCKAHAENGGGAWAEFNLGYTFDMVGPSSPAVVRVRLKASRKQVLSQAPTTTAPATDSTTTGGQLKFLVKDTGGAVIKDEILVSGTGDKGPRDVEQSQDVAFDVNFQNGKGYYLVIAGRCSVDTAAGETADVTMDISDASIEIKWGENGAAKSSITLNNANTP